ncbi:Geranylgeranylglyceryl phosphate synthase [archaeon HR01]|nr:Geranylgeranylglyceryl phosphate synthase [archaeon HR01]
MRLGRVEQYLMDRIGAGRHLHISLLDPVSTPSEKAGEYASYIQESGSDAIMVGGSTVYSQEALDSFIKKVKEEVSIPVIIFPNNVQSISRYADAIWFMSLLNSVDWYYIVGAQLQGALTVKSFNLEAIPMGYVVFGSESTVAAMGRALPLAPHSYEIAVCYGLAAQYLGMRFLYLEAGSGASRPLPETTIRAVRKAVDIPVIVGGGIRTPEDVKAVCGAGADIVVTGTAIERDHRILPSLVYAAKNLGN